MGNKTHLSILETLLYSDMFEYPLTAKQIHRFIVREKIALRDICKLLQTHIPFISKKGRYYFLAGKDFLVTKRQAREQESKKKLKKARFIARLLSFIPWVRLIGISGSLSLNNSQKYDDIDFFIITSQNRLWLTRFLVSVVLLVLCEKRQKNEKIAVDKICPNMFIPENYLQTPLSSRDVFIAHEIVQLKVIINKGKTYEKFLAVNSWVLRFLPNAFTAKKIDTRGRTFFKTSDLLYPVEKVFYLLQLWYMRNQITHETVELHSAQFHPKDIHSAITSLYRMRCTYVKKLLKHTENFEAKLGKKYPLFITPGS